MSIFAKKTEIKQPEPKQEREIDIDLDGATETNGASTSYGIADAMQLMRSLPVDQNIDLVVRVVRVTLGSVNVRIEDIVEDATRRQQTIQDNIAALHEQIAELEEELELRRTEIEAQEADFKETTAVKERLLLAEKSAGFTTRAAGTPVQGLGIIADSPQVSPPPPPPLPRTSLPPPKPAQRE